LRRLLIVDDEADGASFAADLLRLHGLQVRVVHSAPEALEAMQDDVEIDAVLTDVMMPGMSGLQLAETVREKYPSVKIVLMSGYPLPEPLDDQEHRYLFAPKPYRIDTVLELLQR
jgi:CheY-like chemotaxis protein